MPKRWTCYLCDATGTGRDNLDARRGFATHYWEFHGPESDDE